MPDELLDAGLNAPPEPELAPPATEPVVSAPPPAAEAAPKEDTVPVSVLIAERRQRQELQQEVDRLRQPPPAPKPDIPDVPDDQAEKFARRYELYTPNGLDLTRAKQMIADNRKEMADTARQAAEQAIEPLRRTTFAQASKDNFVWAASQVDANGDPLVDPKELAAVWATFPPELASNPEVAKVILKAVVGEQVMSRKAAPRRLDREPAFSEPSGGQRGSGYTISNVEKKVAQSLGMKETDWEGRAKGYQPGVPNRLE